MAFVGPISASAGSTIISVTGSMTGSTIFHATQITGSHTKTADGQSFLRAGSGITVVSSSNGMITINYDGTTHSAGGWSDSGTNVTLSTAGDDVGIGVAEPLGKVHIVQDAAEGIVGFKVDTNDADQHGIKFVSAQTTANALSLEAHSITTGVAFKLHSSASNTSGRSLLKIHNDHASATGAIPLEVVQDSTGPAIKITGESSTPAQPADGTGYLYAKAGGQLYWRSYDQAESQISAISSPAADDIGTGDAAVNLQTSSGNVLIDSQAGSTTIDGHTGVEITSTNSGNITLDSVTGIIDIQDGGSSKLTITEGNSGDVTIKLVTNGKDLIFTDNGDAEGFRVLDAAAGVKVPGEVRTTGIGYTDGDNAITIADGGGITAAAGITSTAAANLFGATSFNDANITNVGSIALDTIINDGTDVTIDSSGDIVLDAGGGDIIIKDDGTEIGRFTNSSSDLVIKQTVDSKDIIFQQDDGNEVIRVGNDRKLYFYDKGGENISSNGSALIAKGGAIILDAVGTISLDSDSGHIAIKDAAVTLAHLSASAGAFTIASLQPMILSSSIGAFEFHDDGLKALEIVIDPLSSHIILSSSIHNKDIIFKGNNATEVFRVDGSANTLAVATAATFSAGITSNAGVIVDNITIDGTEIDLSSGNLTLDVAGNIILDADGGNITLKDANNYGLNMYQANAGDWTFESLTQNKDIIFKVNDSGSPLDVLRLTGIDRPGVIINEGGNQDVDFRIESRNSTHILYVDGYDDFVGIGVAGQTLSPSPRFHVEHSSNTTAAASNVLGNFTMLLKNLSTTTNAFAGIAFDVTSETDEDSISAAIRAERDTSASTTAGNHDANLTFATNDAGDDGLTERMRITHDGLIGMGVTDPDAGLEVFNTSSQLKLSYDASNATTFTVAADGNLSVDSPAAFAGGLTRSPGLAVADDASAGDEEWCKFAMGTGTSKASEGTFIVHIGGAIVDSYIKAGHAFIIHAQVGDNADANMVLTAEVIDAGFNNTSYGLLTNGWNPATHLACTWADNVQELWIRTPTTNTTCTVSIIGGPSNANFARLSHWRIPTDSDKEGWLAAISDLGTISYGRWADKRFGKIKFDRFSHTGVDGDSGILLVREDASTADGDLLGGIGFDSTDGNVPSTILEASCFIAAYAAEAHGTGDKGGDLVFGTTTINENQDTVSHEWMRILDSGLVTLQGNLDVAGTITGPTSITTADLNITDDIIMDGVNPVITMRCDNETATNESAISFIKEGSTIVDNEYLGSIIWYSDEGDGGDESARIRCLAYGIHDTDGTGSQDSAGEIRIYVTPDSATASTESMRIRTGDADMVFIDGNLSEDSLHTEGHQYYEEGTDIDYGDTCVLIDGKIQRSSTAMQKNVCGIAWRKTAQRKIDAGFADLVLENSITGVPLIRTWRDSLGVACNRGKKVGDEWVLDDLYASLWKVASVGDSRQLNDDGGASTQPDLLGFKVCDEGGPIEAGDLLCTSNTSGYLMKQDDELIHAYTVGKSMEDVTFDGTGQASEVYGYIYCG